MSDGWLQRDLAATQAEVAAVRDGEVPPWSSVIRDQLQAHPVEVEALVSRLQARPPSSQRSPLPRLVLPPLALGALAAAAFMLLPGPPAYEVPAMALHETVQLDMAHALGPSIRMDGLAEVTLLEATEQGTVVRVDEGAARFDVDANGPFRELEVLVGKARLFSSGARFVVRAVRGAFEVHVLQGRVVVLHANGRFDLHSGDRWSPVMHVAVAQASPTPKRSQGRSSWVARDTNQAPEPGPMVLLDTSALSPLAPAPEQAAPAQPANAPIAPRSSVAAPPTIIAPTATIASKPSTTSDAPPADTESWLAVLDALDGQGRPDLKLASVDAFLQAHPTSIFAEEADARRIELAAEVWEPRTVLREAAQFLARYPSSPHRLDVLEVHATVARGQMADCVTAAPSYQALAAASQGARRQRALAYYGLCEGENGHLDVARSHLERSLQEGVSGRLREQVEAALLRLR